MLPFGPNSVDLGSYSNSFKNFYASGTAVINGGVESTLYPGQTFPTVSTTSTGGAPENIFVAGRYAYVTNNAAPNANTMSIIDIQNPSNPSTVTTTVTGGTGPRGVWVSGRYAYVANNGGQRLGIIDVSRPAFPVLMSNTSTGGGAVDVAVSGRYAYISNYGTPGKFSVMDVSNPSNPFEVGSVSTTRSYDLALSGRFAYVVDSTNGNTLYVIDVADPKRPAIVATLQVGAGPSDVFVQGRYAFTTNFGADTMSIVDVSDPLNPYLVTSTWAGDGPESVYVAGRYAYVQTGNEEALYVIDVKDANNPSLMVRKAVGGGADVGVWVSGRYTYLLNYVSSTMTIVDSGGSETPGLIAHSAEVGSLQVLGDGQVLNQFSVGGGLEVGQGGIYSQGGLGVFTSSTQATSTMLVNSAINQRPVLFVKGGCTAAGGRLFQIGNGVDDAIFSVGCDGTGYSDIAMTTPATDFAEYIRGDGLLAQGDVLALDTNASSSATQVKQGSSLTRSHTLGVYSTRPAFIGGAADGGGVTSGTVPVALLGQVPTKASAASSSIMAGDELMAGDGGYAVKARGPGMIVGTALENLASGTGTIRVFVRPMWWAGDLFMTDSNGSLLVDDLTVTSSTLANTTSTLIDSPFFSFQGSAWDSASSSAVTSQFSLWNDVQSTSSAFFSIMSNATDTSLLTIPAIGDIALAGKFYPADRGTRQTSRYIFYGGSSGMGGDMMRPNAAGWGTGSYGLAEMFPSYETLESGDLVVVDTAAPERVKKSGAANAGQLVGIVSTKPGFLAGDNKEGQYPIALAGRVPTKVSTENGAIKTGDALAASSQPGVAMRASVSGPSVGLALQDYDGANVTSIIAFVNVTWYSPSAGAGAGSGGGASPLRKQGFAKIAAGDMTVHVDFESVGAYPMIVASPAGDAGSWWLANQTDAGFDIVIGAPQVHDVIFTWFAEPTPDGTIMWNSDNTYNPVESGTGQPMPPAPPPSSPTPPDPGPSPAPGG